MTTWPTGHVLHYYIATALPPQAQIETQACEQHTGSANHSALIGVRIECPKHLR
jgi:hypothetical protein